MVRMITLRCDDRTLHANSIQLSLAFSYPPTKWSWTHVLYLYLWILFDSHSSVQQFIFCQAERMSKVLRWMLVWWARIRIFTLLHFTMCNFCMAHTIQFDDERVFLSAEASERMHRWNLIKMSIDLFHSNEHTYGIRLLCARHRPRRSTDRPIERTHTYHLFVFFFFRAYFCIHQAAVHVTSALMWKRCKSLDTLKMAR